MSGLTGHLRVFVVSDLHAHCDDGDNAPSFLDSRSDDQNPASHPVAGLKKLIKDEELTADALLCPGDLGHQARPEAIRKAWQWLGEIREELGAKHTFATAGNHDLDSRQKYNGYDARGVLQELRPLFPVADEPAFDRYWSRHYVIVTESCYRIVLLNSAAFHGSGSDENQCGRITDVTRKALKENLRDADDGRLNILLCHHHPHPHAELNLGEADLMRGGQLLLDDLSSGDIGQWIVIHGHKHHPKISYGQATTSVAPVVFAAGSMSATLFPELQASVRNQVYLIEFSLDDIRMNGIRATFRSWDWSPVIGWTAAGDRSGLPCLGGFGCRERPAKLARVIAQGISEISLEWDKVLSSFVDVQYLTPGDWRLVRNELERSHGIRVLESDGRIIRLERTR